MPRKMSGGRELVELTDAWKKPERRDFASIQPWLLSLLLLVIAEALVTWAGWQITEMEGWRKKLAPKTRIEKSAATAADRPGVALPTEPITGATPPEEAERSSEKAAHERQSRLTRGKGAVRNSCVPSAPPPPEMVLINRRTHLTDPTT